MRPDTYHYMVLERICGTCRHAKRIAIGSQSRIYTFCTLRDGIKMTAQDYRKENEVSAYFGTCKEWEKGK